MERKETGNNCDRIKIIKRGFKGWTITVASYDRQVLNVPEISPSATRGKQKVELELHLKHVVLE
jgi:hypothetical protein